MNFDAGFDLEVENVVIFEGKLAQTDDQIISFTSGFRVP